MMAGQDRVVLVTGAGGFIGGHVAAWFADRGWRVVGAWHRRRSPVFEALVAEGRLLPLCVELGDPASAGDAIAYAKRTLGTAPSVIAHCAGRASDIGPDRAFRAANFDAVRHLAAAAVTHGSRFVFVSTTDVYGLMDHNAADEDTPLREFPRNPYPHYKIEAERWLRANLPGENWSIVRPAAVWGPGDPTLTPRIVDFLRHSPCIVHFGRWRGSNRWPLAHVNLVAEAVYLAATLGKARGQAANVLDAARTSIDEFYRRLAAEHFPEKRFRTLCLPFWVGLCWGAAVTTLSNASRRDRPIADPSLYAVYAVSRNLDFSNARLAAWREQGKHIAFTHHTNIPSWI